MKSRSNNSTFGSLFGNLQFAMIMEAMIDATKSLAQYCKDNKVEPRRVWNALHKGENYFEVSFVLLTTSGFLAYRLVPTKGKLEVHVIHEMPVVQVSPTLSRFADTTINHSNYAIESKSAPYMELPMANFKTAASSLKSEKLYQVP